MSCDEIDRFRNEGRGSVAEKLPESAQRHLRTCEACRTLQEIWDSPSPFPVVSPESREKIARLIVTGLRPVRPLFSDGLLTVALLALAMLGTVIGAVCLGTAGWHALAPRQVLVVFPLLIAALIVMARVVVSQMVPGSKQPVSSASAIAAICMVLPIGILLLFPYATDAQFLARGIKCWGLGILAAAAAGGLFAVVFRRGAWLRPVTQGVTAGFLSGLVGMVVLEIYCPYLDRAHRGIFHLGSALSAIPLGVGLAVLSQVLNRRRADRRI